MGASSLQELVDSANTIHNSAVEGSGVGEYAPGSKAVLKEAIDFAQGVLDDPDATEADLSYAYANLDLALETFEQNRSTGINDPVSDKIRVYPNPFNDHLFIDSPGNLVFHKISLIDMVGQKRDIPVNASGTVIDMNSLPPVIYLLQIQTQKGEVKKMITKNR